MFRPGLALPITPSRPLAIQSIGLFTSAGTSVPTALGSALLGLKFFEELPVCDAAGEPVLGGRTFLDLDTIDGGERLITMATQALAECLGDRAAPPAALLLALPATVPEPFQPADVLATLCAQAGPSIDQASSRVFTGGRDIVFEILQAAEVLLSTGAREVYVGGVDSLVDRQRLDGLLRAGRIRTATTEGFIPGEGAALLRIARRADADTCAMVVGLGRAQEPCSRDAAAPTEQPNVGAGLARAGRAALEAACLPTSAIAAFIHDAAGERFGFREAAMAMARLRPADADLQIWTPAACAGELGAAYGFFALALAAQFFHKGVIAGDAAVVLGSGDDTARGAAIVTAGPAQPPRRR